MHFFFSLVFNFLGNETNKIYIVLDVSTGGGCILDLWAHEMLSSARRHCRAHGASTCLRMEGMSHRCWDSRVRCSSSNRTAALQPSSQHANRLHTQLRPCTKCTNNHWVPLKYVQRQSCWSHLCYPEVGALTEGAGEGKVLHFPLLCLEGSNTIFLRCLTHQSVGETGEVTALGVCGNHREGLSSPSHEVYTETLCDSLGQRDRDMGMVRQDPHVPLRYSFVLDSLRVGGEEEHDSLTQQVGHSYGGERCGMSPSLMIQLSWGSCLAKT